MHIQTFIPKFKVLNRGKWYLAHEIVMYHGGSWGVTSLQGEPGIDNDHTTAIVNCTGIIDASEQKIELYVGDVIASTQANGTQKATHVIVWDRPNARFAAQPIVNHTELYPPQSLSQEWINTCSKKFVGNCFEFPELLKPI